MVEICAELSDGPTFLAVHSVVLELPGDIVEYLVRQGVAESRNDYAFFQYRNDLKIPIQIKE